MASFSNIFVLFLPKILLLVSSCNVLYVPILLSRLFLRSKSVVKCSTSQSFILTKVSSYRIGTLVSTSKGGLISESFLTWLYSPNKSCQITPLSTVQCPSKEIVLRGMIWYLHLILAEVKNFLRLSLL